MKKGNLMRIIIWGTIFLIVIGLGIAGIISFSSGHGKIGSVRIKTMPIVTTFNNLNELIKFTNAGIDIEANTSKDTIVVSYTTDTNDLEYVFDYEVIDGVDVIKTVYFKSDEQIGNVISEFMIDAVSVLNGSDEREVFEIYTLEDFINTTLEQGIQVVDTDNTRTVYININTSILYSDFDLEEMARNKEFVASAKSGVDTALREYEGSNRALKFYSNNSSVCKDMYVLSFENPEGLNYYVEIDKDGKIISYNIANDSYALSFTKTDADITAEDIDVTIPIIKKSENEIQYNAIVNIITSACTK